MIFKKCLWDYFSFFSCKKPGEEKIYYSYSSMKLLIWIQFSTHVFIIHKNIFGITWAFWTSFQLSSSSKWETVKWFAASSLVTRDLSCPVISTAHRPVGCSDIWYLTLTPASSAFSISLSRDSSAPNNTRDWKTVNYLSKY